MKPGISDYNEPLNFYESYIDSYISLMNKSARNHNISAMKEDLIFMGKAQNLSSELDEKHADMNS